MTTTCYVTGNLGKNPVLRFTSDQTPVIDLSIGSTARRQNKQTQQWEDVGKPLWIRATFWDKDAEQIADMELTKGQQVTVTGILVLNEFQGNDGPVQTLELQRARYLGHKPPRNQGAGNDNPWGNPNTGAQASQATYEDAPF